MITVLLQRKVVLVELVVRVVKVAMVDMANRVPTEFPIRLPLWGLRD